VFTACPAMANEAGSVDAVDAEQVQAGNAPLLVAQAETPTGEVKVSESAEAKPEEAEAEEGEEEAKPPKWWGVSFTYEFSHNLRQERPNASNSLSIDPSFTVPYGVDLNIGLHFGASITTEYSAGQVGARDVTVNSADFDPISLNLSRNFMVDKEYTGFSVGLSLGQMFPYTSKFSGQENGWVYAIKPGVRVGFSKWGLSLNNVNAFQKNFHKYTYRYVKSMSDGGDSPMPMNEWTYMNMTSLRYSVWKMNMGVGFRWATAWRYDTSVMEQASNSMGFSADVGINPYDNINLVLGVTTNGPERRNGGFEADYLTPLDPKFTRIFFDISYSL